ncbi:hypothetical protein [Massilia sp. YMA4]|uniref:hypothetical protein n=1 Tax=Massilia sp. YMA4 TaxID=1593482 RepID=UPI000DD16EF7|nr:hypothetical protein [Massilia sp. YMA4]AXA90613.1 hypothetical protein DPH57_05140 [Massilia sp. YMA4]
MKKILKIAAVLTLCWLAFGAYVLTKPVIALHYAAEAAGPVVYFLNRDDHILKEQIHPGEVRKFRIPRNPKPNYYIDVSLPFSSNDGVELKPPFSRVDVYIGANAKIVRTVVHTDFWARIGAD